MARPKANASQHDGPGQRTGQCALCYRSKYLYVLLLNLNGSIHVRKTYWISDLRQQKTICIQFRVSQLAAPAMCLVDVCVGAVGAVGA